ncbi:DUF6075 family protein [Sporolactobacillus terrae]|uniref:DUF6075 family protein n=1 Tax=Sporolactobacillus terrae TaxID=269673 RepID=UPI001CBB871B|nr:DUF6075 family protein [Sporolactobacillus terrae]UAK18095.1 DUF6075 family protein [Sporolactobacillus terrae]
MDFLNTEHQVRYLDYITRDSTYDGDVERKAFFYLLAAHETRDIDRIYDFEERSIRPEVLDNGLSHGEAILIKFAFHLFNGWECESIIDMFSTLSGDLRNAVLSAIKIRFKME